MSEAKVVELYREKGIAARGRTVEVEALEWSADYYGEHYEIRTKEVSAVTGKTKCGTWLYEHDGVIIKSRADVQRMAMREFDRLMMMYQPDEPIDGEAPDLVKVAQEQYIARGITS